MRLTATARWAAATILVLSTVRFPATPSVVDAAESTGQTAASAADFLDSIGVNTHFSYTNTTYGQGDAAQQALQQLGVRHVRENIPATPSPEYVARLTALGAAGIKIEATVGSTGVPKGGPFIPLSSVVSALSTDGVVTALDAVEGPNEWDVRGGAGWARQVRTYQCALHAAIRADPAMADVAVVAPALSRRANKPQLGDLAGCADVGNDHLYPRNEPDGPDISLERNRTMSLVVAGKPVNVTETGYTNAVNQTNAKQPVSEAVAGVYIPRLFATAFSQGVHRTFLYEFLDERPEPDLADEEQHFGLLRTDLTPKPAYTALQRLIGLVTDTGSAVSATVPVGYTVSGANDVHDLLLSRTDGTSLVLLWRDVELDPLGSATDAQYEHIRVDLTQPAARVEVYRPSAADGVVSTVTDTRAIEGDLGADVTVLRIDPQGVAGIGPVQHANSTTPRMLSGSPPTGDAFAVPGAAAPTGTTTSGPPVVAIAAGAVGVAGAAAIAYLVYLRRRNDGGRVSG